MIVVQALPGGIVMAGGACPESLSSLLLSANMRDVGSNFEEAAAHFRKGR